MELNTGCIMKNTSDHSQNEEQSQQLLKYFSEIGTDKLYGAINYRTVFAKGLGVASIGCGAPVVYEIASNLGGDSQALQTFFGLSGTISIKAMLLFLASGSLVAVFQKDSNAKKACIKKLSTKCCETNMVKVPLYWLLGLIGVIPLTYLNDKYGYDYLDIPLMLAPVSAYRYSQARFTSAASELLSRSYNKAIHRNQHSEGLKERLISNNVSTAKVLSQHLDSVKSVLTQLSDERFSSLLEQFMQSEKNNYIELFKFYINLLEQIEVTRKSAPPPNKVEPLISIKLLAIFGAIVSAIGVFPFYPVAKDAPGYFLHKYADYNNTDLEKHLGIVIGVITFYCHATVAGLSGHMVFNLFGQNAVKAYRYLKLNCTRKGKQYNFLDNGTCPDGFLSGTNLETQPKKSLFSCHSFLRAIVELIKLGLVVSSTWMRVSLADEYTGDMFLIICAFISTFGMGYFGYTQVESFMANRLTKVSDRQKHINFISQISSVLPNLKESAIEAAHEIIIPHKEDIPNKNEEEYLEIMASQPEP